MRRILQGLLLAVVVHTADAQNVVSFGVFGGFNVPITIDQGLENDPRFVSRFSIKGSPFGFYYGYDRPGLGFVISPSYLSIGQTYTIKNTTGGDVGSREINMDYFSLPVGLKFHLTDIAFFRLSVVAALDFSFLVDGKETYTHSASKLRYPEGVSIPIDPPGYSVVYDGVFVPDLRDYVHVSKDKFKSFQLFGGVGMRMELDLNDKWSVMAEGRANFALFDPRTEEYIDVLKNPSGPADFKGNPGAPDLYGARRDIFLQASFGIARIVTTKMKFKARQSAPIPKMSQPRLKVKKQKLN